MESMNDLSTTAATDAPRKKQYLLPILAVSGIVLLLGTGSLFGIRAYNQSAAAKHEVEARRGDVEAMQQRRFDLIPNLVNTVKGFSAQEDKILEKASRLKAAWAAGPAGQKQDIATELEGTIISIVSMSQQYPSIASSEHFINLQYQMEGTENRLAVARVRYNEAVARYHSAIDQFPGSLFGFDHQPEYYKSAPAAATAPVVEFDLQE